ncbi:transcriptional regulator CynR [Solimicrobium silvestre]|uniref:Transcriptional regulator n=1 Tax=Solimicrobium silvestre TaxID=2099400 RepID=A0A2S9GVV3_9BURK|nr:transcriptional regulator CynR [Solimicrobium silvestre]PRC91786.1 Transcriptional regulator [Solimicrobium silvestre]
MILRHIRYLLAVVEHGNFTRAAESLYVSQPTLSQQIKQLEEQLGVQLLDRSGRLVRATDAGEAYLNFARKALRELDAGQRAIHDVGDLTRGTLRLAMTPTLTSYLVGPLIAEFTTRHPGIRLHINEMPLDTIETALLDDQVDLGIAFSQVRSPEIDCRILFDEKLSVVVGKQHPFAQRSAPITANELEQELLALLTPNFATRNYVDAYFQQQGISPNIVIEANTINAIVEIVRRGNIATILPDALTRENELLRNINLTPALPHRTVALLRRKDAYQSSAALAFTQLLDEMIDSALFDE